MKNWFGISNIWRALISSLLILTEWLVWKPGNGRDIRIGVDPMVGSQHYYKLSGNLITTLKQKGIISLANVEIEDVENSFITS
jgi:hypothetical protein